MENIRNVIISRTDNMGDVILTLPMAAIIKAHFPKVKIFFLARNYVADIIKACPHIDAFVSWDALAQLPPKTAISQLNSLNIDVILHVFPQKKIASYAYAARIPHRIGTNRRWFHYLYCNHRVAFSRSSSLLHEAQLNLKLLTACNIKKTWEIADLIAKINLKHPESFNSPTVNALLCNQRFNLVIHPLSNGHGREWPIHYFSQLISELPQEKFNFIITGTEAEKAYLQNNLLKNHLHVKNAVGELSLKELMLLIKKSDAVLASGTGPMHLAAALEIPTLGVFPPQVAINAKRWGPLGKKACFLQKEINCNKKCSNRACQCMYKISVAEVKNIILGWSNV